MGIEKGQSISGIYKERTMWAIKKLYQSNDDDWGLGEKISVFMESINQETSEYLVNLELLEEKLKLFDILRLNESELKMLNISDSFRNFKEYENNIVKNKNETYSAILTDREKEYSYLNTTFVFHKKNGQKTPN